MVNNVQLFKGDCLEVMDRLIKDGVKVDLTVTSPPYDDVRDYNNTLVWNFDVFKNVANKLYKLTSDGGVVVWVIGDKTKNGSETGTSFKQALYFKEIGFNLWDTMIYMKKGGLKPNPSIPRYAPDFEYMFVLSKGKPKTFNEIRVPCSTAGEKIGGSKKQRQVNGELKAITLTHQEVQQTKRKGNVWEYGVGNNKTTKDRYAFKHPAMFPEKLVEDHILSWSNEGDLVFDCFMGANTTGKMALLNNRKFIGIEKVEEYFEIAKKRIEEYGNG
jgi:site-specific DNA-methyltransferase (adenine-specific)